MGERNRENDGLKSSPDNRAISARLFSEFAPVCLLFIMHRRPRINLRQATRQIGQPPTPTVGRIYDICGYK